MSEEQVANPQQEQPQATGDQQPVEGDFLRKAAEAMVTASEAIKSGAGDAKTAAAKVYPATQRVVSKSLYATCYYVSYGLVFSSMLVAGLIPKNTPIYFGFVDGAQAAQDTVHKMYAQRSESKAGAQATQSMADGAGVVPLPA